ncbi:MAG: signal transduction histidine kinase, partial [Myxococcota bacterium]
AFYRPTTHAETRDGGVGLGLSMVREIARAHGGRVTCEPRSGGGMRFEVALPSNRLI